MQIIKLNRVSAIIPYFQDNGEDLFDCGQGYYQDHVTVVVQIDDDYYQVGIMANIESSKQDHGDRLYYVDEVTDVVHTPISKEEAVNQINSHYQAQINELENQILNLRNQMIGDQPDTVLSGDFGC